MPRPTFTWHPDVSSEIAVKPNVHVTKFGDGYEVRTSVGLNTMPEKWSVKFTRAKAESDAIVAFLKARGGVESFNWTTPDSRSLIFVCREWKVTRLRGEALEITCDFEQVFEF